MSGFIYLWYDNKHKRFYIGSHWGTPNDGYICSSRWMRKSYKRRPEDFKRRIISTITTNKKDLLIEEERWLSMIKDHEIGKRYYNLIKKASHIWWGDPEKAKTIGEKISKAHKGKPKGPCSPEKAAKISEAKKAKFDQRREETGQALTPEHIASLQGKPMPKHTEEWKQNWSEQLKQQWMDGTRPRPEKTVRQIRDENAMSKEEQAILISTNLKARWADPEWAARQRERLKEGAKKRPPRSEESKLKASLAQKGKPKNRRSKEA